MLNLKIAEYESRITSLSTLIDNNNARTTAMNQHLRNVKQEIAHIQVRFKLILMNSIRHCMMLKTDKLKLKIISNKSQNENQED